MLIFSGHYSMRGLIRDRHAFLPYRTAVYVLCEGILG